MASAVITRSHMPGGWLISIITASGRASSNRAAGHSPQEAAATLANEMIRHHIWKSSVIAPPEVMEHIEKICPGRRIR